MAKRRKLELPNLEDLNKLEAEFRSETPAGRGLGLTPPIAQVAAEIATSAPVIDAETRAAQARDTHDAERLRAALEKGLIMQELPIDAIKPDDLDRDRVQVDEDEMMELRTSIATNGLRLPIEVYEMAEPEGKFRYGVISGYRRLLAFNALYALSGQDRYATIKAVVKAPKSTSDALVAMVEENEVRSNLSHFERGRVAAMAAQNGFYATVEEAVNTLFASGSKAKRSKIRSFATIFEELGDMLNDPETLSERQGLRIANVLRMGAGGRLREALDDHRCTTAADDWAVIEPILKQVETGLDPTAKRAGRPKVDKPSLDTRRLANGITLRQTKDRDGFAIHISGRQVDQELTRAVLDAVERLLDRTV